jgi:glycosyltransferase involved in cell wall biosynthesis
VTGAPGPAPGERVRVLHVITRLILGGAQENTLFTVIGQQKDPRLQVTLLAGSETGAEGDLHDEARAAGVDLVLLPALVREIRPWQDLRALVALVRFMRARRFHIVHTHSSKAGILARLAARIAGVPIVVHTLHSLVFHEYQSALANRVYVLLKRMVAPFTHAFISVNDGTAQGALAAGIGRPEQHVTIFSGMPLEPFLDVAAALPPAEAKRRLGIPEDAPVVGKIARLTPLKGHEQFLDAAGEIARAEPRAHFLLVGNGILRADLEARARAMGLADRVVFAGLVPPESVPAHIQAMDVVVHSSLREGIARVLPQAGAVGKPVVTFALDGAPEVIRDGVSGYLVPAGDTAALARRTVELLRDPARRAEMGAAGRAFASAHFAVETMVARITEVYDGLLRTRATGGC